MKVRLVLVPRRERLGQLLLEAFERVVYDIGMHYTLLQAVNELTFKILPTN